MTRQQMKNPIFSTCNSSMCRYSLLVTGNNIFLVVIVYRYSHDDGDLECQIQWDGGFEIFCELPTKDEICKSFLPQNKPPIKLHE